MKNVTYRLPCIYVVISSKMWHMSINLLIGSLVTSCKNLSLNITDNTEAAIKALIVLSMRSIDHKLVLEKCLPDVYVDWHIVATMVGGNVKNPVVNPLFIVLFELVKPVF